MSKEMLEAFRILEEEKHINKEDIIDAVKESLKSAYKRRYGQSESCVIEFDDKKGDFKVYTVREVVEEVFDSRLEISLSDALKISSAYELGDKIRFEESVAEFGRVAAQSAKQTIMEKMRRQIREVTYNEYKQHEGEIMTGTVERFDQRFIYVNLGSLEAQLSHQDQIPGETFKSHDRIEVYVYKVENNPKGVNVFVSRSHPQFIKRIMEQEIPEVFDGTVEIMSVSREAGDRTKVAVRSHNPNVDAIGTIVGRGGSNIKKVISKFHPKRYDAKAGVEVPIEENIDVIQWVEDPAEFIYNAIAPAEVDMVLFDEEDSKRATVVVPDNKLSLAIGRRGQNVRLAAHLTGYRIDIKSASEYEALEAEREANAAVAQEEVAPVEEAAESVETEVVANDVE
ncbi:MAG: transcription termination/antitermination protein NusA [Streptococcus gallolyticus]|uniref:Transcription termination/antitermination protein NusA n=1 Tax=Streptococcus gallolyticus TaxID=315405 RepID=A0A927XGR9_9STRE|nr:transcription termination/antitermination protein NusA [Streptococcus gallolyticus]